MAELLTMESSDMSGISPVKVFATEPVYGLAIAKTTLECIRAKPSCYQDEDDKNTLYVTANGCSNVNSSATSLSFKTFADNYFSAYKVYLNRSAWKLSTCTCVSFQENLECKHVFGLSYTQKLPNCELLIKANLILMLTLNIICWKKCFQRHVF